MRLAMSASSPKFFSFLIQLLAMNSASMSLSSNGSARFEYSAASCAIHSANQKTEEWIFRA